jgi:hypothetical protein
MAIAGQYFVRRRMACEEQGKTDAQHFPRLCVFSPDKDERKHVRGSCTMTNCAHKPIIVRVAFAENSVNLFFLGGEPRRAAHRLNNPVGI